MTFSTSVYQDNIIICTNQGQQNHGEEAFVVVEHTAWDVWFPDDYMLALQGPEGRRNIPRSGNCWAMAFSPSVSLAVA